MNVYDFDKTVYRGDSTLDFYRYCIAKYPFLLKYVFSQGIGALVYLVKHDNKTQMKERFYAFLMGIDDIDALVKKFWESHKDKISPWYLEQKRMDDVIISASPEFLLWPICEELKTGTLIASRVNKKTGAYTGLNCRGEEKVQRFFAAFPSGHIERFYSDSLTDQSMADISEKSYLVKRGKVSEWRR